MGNHTTHQSKYNWTVEDLQFIKENVAVLTDKEMAVRLSTQKKMTIPQGAIVNQRKKLGIKKSRGRGKCLVVEQIETAPF